MSAPIKNVRKNIKGKIETQNDLSNTAYVMKEQLLSLNNLLYRKEISTKDKQKATMIQMSLLNSLNLYPDLEHLNVFYRFFLKNKDGVCSPMYMNVTIPYFTKKKYKRDWMNLYTVLRDLTVGEVRDVFPFENKQLVKSFSLLRAYIQQQK